MIRYKNFVILFSFTILFIILFYEIFTGGFSRGVEQYREGESFYIIYASNFKEDIIYIDRIKFSQMDYKMNGHKNEYKEILIKKGYVENGKNILCKKHNSVTFRSDDNFTYIKYRMGVKECENYFDKKYIQC